MKLAMLISADRERERERKRGESSSHTLVEIDTLTFVR